MADQIFAVNSGFYDAVNSDRTYSADDMNRPYKRVVSNGVFATPKGTPSTDLQVVSANNGMQIIVQKGEGIFGDKWFENPSALSITVPSNTSTVPRIDSVIVQVDKRTSGRVGNIVYRTGTPSLNPSVPTINQVANVTEYRLANVRVNAGVSAITGGMITDRRGSADCPWVTSLIYQVDTSTLYDQWATAYEEYFTAEKKLWDDWYSHLTEELNVSLTLVKRTNTFVTVAETSNVLIGIPEYNAVTDMLEVYINGLRAIEGNQYTVNGNESITLSAPLGAEQTVDFIVLKSVVMGNTDDIITLIDALEDRIATIQGGSPTVVDSISAMADTDKIYVLASDSKWYYYNLSSASWVAGGVYGGVPTDKTLSQNDMAADAEATGDAINDIKIDMAYNGLGVRIDNWINGYRIINSGSVLGDVGSKAGWRYCKIQCSFGDAFVINSKTSGYTGYRAWAFVDAGNNILAKKKIAIDTIDEVIVAPEGSAYLVCNDYSSDSVWSNVCYKKLGISNVASNIAVHQNDVANNHVDFGILNSTTINGISFEVDKAEGTITAKGTASSNALYRIDDMHITGASKVMLRGCPSGGNSNTYNIAIYDQSTGSRIAWNGGSDDLRFYDIDPSHTYVARVVIFSGVSLPEDGLVFTPEIYTDGLLFDELDKINSVVSDVNLKANTKYMYFAGTAFICECGNHIYIDAVNFRLYDKVSKTYTASLNGTIKLAGGYTSVNYIHFDGTNFSRSTSYDDDVIAYVSSKYVTPLVDGIIPNYRKIMDGYVRSDSEYYINFKRMPFDALMDYREPSYKISERGYVIKEVGERHYVVNKRTLSFELIENNENIGNKKILMIGDSFVARGFIQNWLHAINGTLEFVGTKTTQNYGYKSEGVSGSRLYYFTDPATSPFYFDGALDFGAYLSNNNIDTPDYVVINSAINHTTYNNATYGTYLSNLVDLVNMIRSYSTTIKIYVTYGANYAVDPGSTYGYPNNRYNEVRTCCNSVYDVENVTVVPVDSALIDELDYNAEDIDYLGSSVKVLSDCVHPSEGIGFRKIANMIYNYLGM